MKKFLSKVPMSIVGVMLAFAALGNLVQSYGDMYRNILGSISAIIFIIATIKFITNIEGLKNDLNTPIGASIFPTYSMGIIILATYVKPYNNFIAYVIWIIGILLHIILALVKLLGLLKLKFYPTYSAFTFPMVISALAFKLSVNFMKAQEINVGMLPTLVKSEELIAVIIVFYVLIRFVMNLTKQNKI